MDAVVCAGAPTTGGTPGVQRLRAKSEKAISRLQKCKAGKCETPPPVLPSLNDILECHSFIRHPQSKAAAEELTHRPHLSLERPFERSVEFGADAAGTARVGAVAVAVDVAASTPALPPIGATGKNAGASNCGQQCCSLTPPPRPSPPPQSVIAPAAFCAPRVKSGRLSPLAVDDSDAAYCTARECVSESEGALLNEKRCGKSSRIRVIVRKRPLSAVEDGEDCVSVDQRTVRIGAMKQRVDLSEYTECHDYAFDDAFGENESNADVYNRCCKDLINCVFECGSASCFAYGQTGSGKTYTMLGTEGDVGLYVLAAQDIFARVTSSQRVFVSLYEIYCNTLFDLLNHRAVVVVREDGNHRVNVCGLTRHEIRRVRDLVRLIEHGTEQRRTGSTSANEYSSRSHAVFNLAVPNHNHFIATQAPRCLNFSHITFLLANQGACNRAVDID